jgi:hypothetical protein
MSASILMLIARILLGVCLYGFLGMVLYFLWRDLRTRTPSASGIPARYLLRWTGADGDIRREYPLGKASCLIGRSPTTEIPIADETVSTVHARVWRSDDRWQVEDLNSRNGTFLNEIPVEKTMVLCPGDRLRIGRCVLVFLSVHPETPTRRAPETSPLPSKKPPPQDTR